VSATSPRTRTLPDVAANLWRGAAEGGAQAIAQPVGRLVPGCRADLVVLDAADIDFEGLSASAALAVAMFSGSSNRVRDVFIAGAPVIRDRRHAREEAAAAAFRAALRRLRS
jgi:formimidoylglutamate deiminase